jgi:hypothetical protein
MPTKTSRKIASPKLPAKSAKKQQNSALHRKKWRIGPHFAVRSYNVLCWSVISITVGFLVGGFLLQMFWLAFWMLIFLILENILMTILSDATSPPDVTEHHFEEIKKLLVPPKIQPQDTPKFNVPKMRPELSIDRVILNLNKSNPRTTWHITNRGQITGYNCRFTACFQVVTNNFEESVLDNCPPMPASGYPAVAPGATFSNLQSIDGLPPSICDSIESGALKLFIYFKGTYSNEDRSANYWLKLCYVYAPIIKTLAIAEDRFWPKKEQAPE